MKALHLLISDCFSSAYQDKETFKGCIYFGKISIDSLQLYAKIIICLLQVSSILFYRPYNQTFFIKIIRIDKTTNLLCYLKEPLRKSANISGQSTQLFLFYSFIPRLQVIIHENNSSLQRLIQAAITLIFISNNKPIMLSKSVDDMTNHRIDMAMLAIIFVGFFSCLIRSDYNLLIIFFCYFVWQNRKDALSLKIIAGATIILFVIDLLFLLVEIPIWTSVDQKNPVWQTIRSLHGFGIFCFVIINILKLILLVITLRANSSASQANSQ